MGSIGANKSSAGVGAVANNTDNTFPTGDTIDTKAAMDALRKQMGQTGYEAGDPNASPHNKVYVKTSKAFNINAYLNSDGKTIDSDNSDWQNLGYTKKDAENAIKQIDAGMKPLPKNISVVRFIGGTALKNMFGLNTSSGQDLQNFIARLETDKTAQANFQTVLQNTQYTQKGYSSTTTVQQHPAFDDRAVRINMVMRSGTPAIVTKNDAEMEVLGGRGLKYNFKPQFRVQTIKSRTSGRIVKQLVIDAYV